MATVGGIQGGFVPPGGAAGSQLVKNSDASGDVGWATLTRSEPAIAYPSGYWHANAQRYYGSTLTSTLSIAANNTFYFPAYLWSSITINALAVSVSTAGATTASLGVQGVNADGTPGALLTPAVTGISCSVAGVKTVTIPNLAIGSGWFWLALGVGPAAVVFTTVPLFAAWLSPTGEYANGTHGNLSITRVQPDAYQQTAAGGPVANPATAAGAVVVGVNPALICFKVV